jgi:aspartyl-tRNA(Asn)/glutamyl-tRNA(Gln) amidotransferase subunit A
VKPTYGLVSRYGLVAYASSLDQIGPFATTVADAALLTEVIAGHDVMDSTSIPLDAPSLVPAVTQGVAGMKIGRVTDLPEGAEPEVTQRLNEAFAALEKAGATIVDITLPSLSYALTAYYLIAPAEASSNLARFDGVRYGLRVTAPDTNAMYGATRAEGFGDEVKRRIMLGTYALSAGYYDAYYGKALKVRRLIAQDFERAYQSVDVILTPTSPVVAFKFGDKVDDPMSMYLCDIYTIPTNLAGHPGMSVPFGTGANGMPVGVQVLAPALGEVAMFRVGGALELAAGGVS